MCSSVMCSSVRMIMTVAIFTWGIAVGFAAPLPELPSASGHAIHRLDYPDAGTARQVWKSVYGSAPASVAPTAGQRNVLKLPCVFKGNKLERGCWEWSVDLDLSACRGVEFQIYCDDVSPISNFTLYLQTGQGWYGLNFNPEYAGRWCKVVLDKSKAIPEGAPAGWGKIRTVRFSAWRGYDSNTDIYLADLAMVGVDAPIVLARPASGGQAVQVVVDALQQYEMPYFVVNESEVDARLLANRKLLVLLGESKLSDSAAGAIQGFAKSGGKVLSFGKLPAAIASLTGVRSVELPQSSDAGGAIAVLKLVADAAGLWDEAVKQAIVGAGRVAGYGSLDDAVVAIRKTAGGAPDRLEKANAQIERATKLISDAIDLQKSGKPEQAIIAANDARAALVDAYCVAQSPQSGEHRAFWCHEALGVKGMPWDESIRILAENGFTAILPNMLWAGVAYYDSKVLPVWPKLGTRGNPLVECLAACKKYGIECHAWKVNWYMSGRSPRAFIDLMKSQGRTQVEFNGKGKDDWLCPSHPENRKLEIDSMVELATLYDVAGIHFDYIRYPGLDSCFCAGCRERFEKSIGKQVANWPADTRKDAGVREQWLEWRRGNITAVVQGVAKRVRAERPKVKISAAVFRIWPVDRDGVAQDWKLWCEKGWLDFVCPMDYTPNVPQFRDMIRHQLEWACGVPCYPGIGVSVWPERNDVCRMIDQINVTRELKTGGFTVFNYAQDEAAIVLPAMGKGITSKN